MTLRARVGLAILFFRGAALAETPKPAPPPIVKAPVSASGEKRVDVKLAPGLTASAPPSPMSFAATAGVEQVTLSWTQPTAEGTAPVETYLLQRSTDGTTWSDVATIPPNLRQWFDRQRTAGVGLAYRIFASSANAGRSASSAIANATPIGPAAPPALVFVGISGDKQLNISWGILGGVKQTYATGGSSVTSYILQRSTDGKTWTDHKTMTANDGIRNGQGVYQGYTATDTNLTPGAVVQYRVIAVNGAGRSVPSAPVNGVAATFPGPPENVKMNVVWGTVGLKWDPPKNSGGTPVTQYKIEVWIPKSGFAAPGGDGYWYPRATVPGGSGMPTSYSNKPTCGRVAPGPEGVKTDIGCPLDRKWYRILTVNAVGDSSPSTPVSGVL